MTPEEAREEWKARQAAEATAHDAYVADPRKEELDRWLEALVAVVRARARWYRIRLESHQVKVSVPAKGRALASEQIYHAVKSVS